MTNFQLRKVKLLKIWASCCDSFKVKGLSLVTKFMNLFSFRLCSAGFMALLTHVTILLVLACISHQIVLSSCQKSHGRRGSRGQNKEKSGPRLGPQPKSAPSRPIKGSLVTKDKSECTWEATGEDLVILSVTCKTGGSSSSCEYVARPSVCPQYASNVRLYWKQMTRALKKQRRLCEDSNVLIKAGVCRRAARDAHFKLQHVQRRTTPPPTSEPAPRAVKSCRAESEKRAEEYCNDSWSSVCTFLFAMVEDCWDREKNSYSTHINRLSHIASISLHSMFLSNNGQWVVCLGDNFCRNSLRTCRIFDLTLYVVLLM